MTGVMKRGLGQVLFYFTPGRTFDHTENIINIVKNIEGEEIRDINRRMLVSIISRRLNDFMRRSGFPKALNDERRYIFLKPRRVIGSIFPTVYRCSSCGRVRSYSEFEIERGTVPICRICGKRMSQIHHVMVCKCGRIDGIRVPRCREHGDRDIVLDDRSERYRDFKWKCLSCNRVIETGLRKTCSCGNEMGPAVHTNSSVYQVHHVTVVDMPEIREDFVENMDNFTLVAGALTGVFKHPEEKKIADFEGGFAGKLISAGIPETKIEKLRELLRSSEEFSHLLGEDEETKNRLIEETRKIMDEKLLEKLYQRRYRIFEYIKMMEDPGVEPIKLETVLRNERVPEEDILESRNLLSIFGISEIYYTTSFPVVNAVFGYTRLYNDEKPDEITLRAFPTCEGKTPIYVNRICSEAIFVRLDPSRVLKWLSDNGFPVNRPSGVRPRDHSEILRHLDSVEPYTVSEVNKTTRAVFGLQHTISHLMIREASVLSGMERTSISEFHFPEALTFAIYIYASESFMMGGFLTLLVQSLSEWLYGSHESGKRCIYDPVCIDSDGACHACTHLSEISCQFFNSSRFLDRRLVYGGGGLAGYWEDIE